MCHCRAVVKELFARADDGDVVFCLFVPFCFFLFFFFILSFLLAIFFFILIADPPGYALGSMYILSSSPEFYFGKGSSKALDMHIGHACDQVKTISCQDMSLL